MLVDTGNWCHVDDADQVDKGPLDWPPGYGENTGLERLAQDGWYSHWLDDPERPGQYYDKIVGEITFNEAESRCEQVNAWDEWTPERKREAIEQDIGDQVPDATVQTTVRDPEVENDIGRYIGAASDKAIALQNTPDGDLDTFDSTLDPAPPSDGKGYARFAVDQKRTADGNVSLSLTLEIQREYEDDGANARADIVQAPLGSGANALPFIRDPNNADGTESNIWRITPDWLATNYGYKWADEDAECICQLRWGAASLVVSPQMTSRGLDKRTATWVRYGVASGTRAQGSGMRR